MNFMDSEILFFRMIRCSVMHIILFVLIFFSFLSDNLAFPSNEEVPDLIVSLPFLPGLAESKEKGLLVDFVRAMDDIYEGNIFILGVFPFKRSINNILVGKADFHMPGLSVSAEKAEQLKYISSEETLFVVTFALYTQKGVDLDLNNLDLYKIEIDKGLLDFFPKHFIPSFSIKQSIKKLCANRIDGFIFAAKETDEVIDNLSLTSKISSCMYQKYEVKILFPTGNRGKKVESIISSLVKKLKENNKQKEILGPILAYYENWHPRK